MADAATKLNSIQTGELIMTFLNKFSTGLLSAGILFGVLAAPVVGHAATKTSDAEVDISAPKGDAGTLKLVQVPNLTFGSTPGHKTLTQNTNGSIIVDDETGTASGWNLSAQLTDFQVVSGVNLNQTLSGTTLGLYDTADPTLDTSDDTASIGAAPRHLGAQLGTNNVSSDIVNAAYGQGIGKWNIPVQRATLNGNFPKVTANYKATMTWNLTSGPTSSTPALSKTPAK